MYQKIEEQFLLNTLKKVMSFDSPTGYTKRIVKECLIPMVEELGYKYSLTTKGNLVVEVPGEQAPALGLCAHVDTLGAMVRSIDDSGDIHFTVLGGPLLTSFDSEYAKLYTRNHKVYTGTFFSKHPAVHVYKDASTLERDEKNMIFRLDEVVKSKEDVKNLGIQVGDIIAIDTKTTVTESGFIKSRFLDDKASVAILLSLLYEIKRGGIVPKKNLKVLFSTYEEVGHGMSYLPQDISELIAVDMGCIGDDLSCTEMDVSICAKDSSGPYDYEMVSSLIEIAKQQKLDFAVDIYPYYGSDASAAMRGGQDVKCALIGPGVYASHGLERTHKNACIQSLKLLLHYISK